VKNTYEMFENFGRFHSISGGFRDGAKIGNTQHYRTLPVGGGRQFFAGDVRVTGGVGKLGRKEDGGGWKVDKINSVREGIGRTLPVGT
jgi:hypothetical protein